MKEKKFNKNSLLTVIAIVYTILLVLSACAIKIYTGWFSDKTVTTIITVGYVILFVPLMFAIGKLSVKKMVLSDMVFLALLIAVHVIFSRLLAIQTPITKISLSFLPMTLCAMKFGAGHTMIMGGLADIIGAIVFPTGPYFPVFTLTEVVRGFIFGSLLHKKVTLPKASLAVILSQTICSLAMNSMWMTFIGAEFVPTIISRIPQVVIMIPLQIIVIPLFAKSMDRISLKTA